MRSNNLKATILKIYPTESACAKAMGWPRQRLNRITTGAKVPDLYEVKCLALATNMSLEKMAGFFLEEKSPNGQRCKNREEA